MSNNTACASVFFLDAGDGPFVVTANHVIDGWRRDCAVSDVVALQLVLDLRVDLDGKNAVIASHTDLDIATFRIAPQRFKALERQL
jgi:hypothetical protein